MAEPKPPTNELGAVRSLDTLGKGSALLGGAGLGGVEVDFDPTPAWRWPERVSTIDAMRRDAQVMTLENAAILPIRRWPWAIKPGAAREEVARFVASNLGLGLVDEDTPPASGRFSWSEHLRLALRAPSYGASWFEQVAELRDDGWLHLRKLAPRPLRTIAKVNVARDGGLEGIVQGMGVTAGGLVGAGSNGVTIPVDRLVAYVWDADPGSWSGASMLRPLYRHYWLKDKLYRIDAMKHERFGAPMVVFEAPDGATDAQLEALNIMAQAVRAGASAGGAVPMGTKAHLIGATGTGTDVVASIAMHDQAMARAWSAMVVQLAQSGEGGNRALGGTFADLLHAVQVTIAQSVVDVANPHVIRDLVDWNWGPDEPAPELVFLAPEDTALSVGDLMLAIGGGLLTVDDDLEAAFRAKYRLPERMIGADVRELGAPAADPLQNLARAPRRARAAAGPGSFAKLPDRPVSRDLNEFEVRAATDFRALDDAWQDATDEAVSRWLEEVQPAQREAMFAAIREADGDLVALAELAAPVLGAEVIEEAIRAGIASGIAAAVEEAAAQGVSGPVPSIDDALADIPERAEAMAITLARSYSEAAGRHAMLAVGQSSTADEVVAAVEEKLDRLTDAFLRDNLGAAVQGGQNAGRFAVFEAVDVDAPTGYYASEILDGNTCGPCRDVDGTRFATIEEAMAAYPMLGAYRSCEGGGRCRGTVVAVYDEAPATA